jgi:hypothetical protein
VGENIEDLLIDLVVRIKELPLLQHIKLKVFWVVLAKLVIEPSLLMQTLNRNLYPCGHMQEI